MVGKIVILRVSPGTPLKPWRPVGHGLASLHMQGYKVEYNDSPQYLCIARSLLTREGRLVFLFFLFLKKEGDLRTKFVVYSI